MFGIPSRISGRLTISSLEGLRRETSFCRIVSDTSYSISSLINSMAKTYNTCIIFYSTTKILLLIYMYMWYWMIQSMMFNWQMINDTLCIHTKELLPHLLIILHYLISDNFNEYLKWSLLRMSEISIFSIQPF